MRCNAGKKIERIARIRVDELQISVPHRQLSERNRAASEVDVVAGRRRRERQGCRTAFARIVECLHQPGSLDGDTRQVPHDLRRRQNLTRGKDDVVVPDLRRGAS